MKNIRGKSLKEWKEDSDKERHNIPMRTQKYIVCLEERIKQLLIQRVVRPNLTDKHPIEGVNETMQTSENIKEEQLFFDECKKHYEIGWKEGANYVYSECIPKK